MFVLIFSLTLNLPISILVHTLFLYFFFLYAVFIVLDCKTNDEYLDDESEDRMDWRCVPCPLGGNCTEKSTLFARDPQSNHLLPQRGYWVVPTEFRPDVRQPYVECKYPDDCLFNATSNITCHNNTKGALCSTCEVGFDRISRRCAKCRDAEVPIRVTLLCSFFVFLGLLLHTCRRRIQRLHAKYGAAWRDAALAIKILITFVQISQSLPWTLEGFIFPSTYRQFLNRLGVVNINFLSLIGIQCLVDMDYRYGVFMAFAIPIVLVAICWVAFLVGKIKILSQELQLTDQERKKVIEDIFDIADFDESDEIDEAEVSV